MLLRRKNIFLEHTWLVVIVVVVLAGPQDLLLDCRMFRCPMSYIYISMASAMSSSLFFKNWPYLIASSTVASLTSTFLGWNLLKAVGYSPLTGWSSGLILSLYCDGCQYLLDLIQLVLADRSMQCYRHIDRFLLLVGFAVSISQIVVTMWTR